MRKLFNKKAYRDSVAFFGTDIPLMSTIQFMMVENIREQILQKKTAFLSMDEIFEQHTYTKKARFEFIAKLIKLKFISRKKINQQLHEYKINYTMSFRDCIECRVYNDLTRHDKKKIEAEMKRYLMNK